MIMTMRDDNRYTSYDKVGGRSNCFESEKENKKELINSCYSIKTGQQQA